MSLPHRHLSEFDSNVEEWTVYVERLENYLVVNDIEDNRKKRAVLLSVCGPSTYCLIRNIVAPEKPASKEYGDLKKNTTILSCLL